MIGWPQPSPGDCMEVWTSNLAEPTPLSSEPAHLISFEVNWVKNALELTSIAVSCVKTFCEFGTTEAQLAAVSVKNHGNAMHNPLAHKPMRITVDDVLNSRPVSSPYKLLDCSLISDGAGAVVLTRDNVGGRSDRRPAPFLPFEF